MRAYKIVFDNGTELRSSWAEGVGTVVYRVGHASKPNLHCGPLCAFANLEAAGRFLMSNFPNIAAHSHPPMLRIFACDVVEAPCQYGSIWIHDIYLTGAERLPSCTVLCSEITLIEEVR